MPSDPPPPGHRGAHGATPPPPPPAPALSPPPAPTLTPGPPTGGATTPTGDVDASDPAPHRLPPVSMLSGLRPQSLGSAIPALFVAYGALREFAVVGLVALAVLTAIVRIVHWQRFRWGFDGQVLHVHSGVVWRSKRAVDVARMQQVELERPLLHRFLGTAVLRVETAADAGETEVALNGLEVDAAESLRSDIRTARRGTAAPTVTPGTADGPVEATATAATSRPSPPTLELHRPSVGDLVRHAVTGRALLLLPVGLGALAQFGDDLRFFGDDLEDAAGAAAETASSLGVALAVLLGVVLLVVVGLVVAIGATLLRDWDLVLAREGDDLRLSRGLLDQRSATVPVKRLQVIEYQQNWVRRRVGVGTMHLRSAGGGGSDQDRRVTVPWVPRDVAARILSIGLGGVVDDADGLPFHGRQHPQVARRRLWFQWLRGSLLPIVGLATIPWFLLPDQRRNVLVVGTGIMVLAVVATWFLAGAQYRRLGHDATDRVVLVTGGVLGRVSTWMPLGRLQGVEAHANPFQRRLDLITVVLAPAGGNNQPVEIRDVDRSRAVELTAHLVEVAAGRVVAVDPVGRADPSAARLDPSPGPA